MSADHRDDRDIEALLRRALHEQAELIRPAGDGLAKIQQRAAERRRRRAWLRPSIAALAAAVAVVLAVALPTLVQRSDRGGDSAANRPPAHSAAAPPTARPTPSARPTPTAAAPAWPYRDTRAARNAGPKPAQLEPTELAQTFVTSFLSVNTTGATQPKLVPTLEKKTSRTLTVAVRRADLGGRPVCEVLLSQVSDSPAAYVVTGATSDNLTVRTTTKVERALTVPITGTFQQSPSPQVAAVWSALVQPDGSIGTPPDRNTTGSVSSEPGAQPWTVQLNLQEAATSPGMVAAWTVDSDGQVLDFAAAAAK